MSSEVVCGPLPIVAALGVYFPPKSSSAEYCISEDPKAWLSHSVLHYSFINADPNAPIDDWKIHFVERAIAEYGLYANIDLKPVKEGEEDSADIRISFDGNGGAWSAIGTDARRIVGGATMNLGFLSGYDKMGPTSSEERETLYNFVLHEFGHAFGLTHEWKHGPTVPESRNEAINQHISVYKDNDTSNFPDVDVESIMNFFIPGKYTNAGDLRLKGGLSKKDKAWLTLIYPGRAGGGDPDTGILRSLKDLEVPIDTSSRILLANSVSEMRFAYHEYISERWKNKLNAYYLNNATRSVTQEQLNNLAPELHVLNGKVTGITPLIDHNREDDLNDAVAAAVLNPQFSNMVANIVNQGIDGGTDIQHIFYNPNAPKSRFFPLTLMVNSINPHVPPDAQNFILPIIKALGGIFGSIFSSGLPPGAASGVYPQALPPDIQQGIFSALLKLVQSPAVINIIKGVAGDMLQQQEHQQEEQALRYPRS